MYTRKIMFVLVFLLSSCKDLGEEAKPADWHFIVPHKRWTLYSLVLDGNPVPIPMIPSQDYSLVFEDETNFRARSHCNECFGTYRVGPQRSLKLSDPICTEMACPLPSLAGTFENALRRVSSYRIEESTLVLVIDNGKGTLRFYHNIR